MIQNLFYVKKNKNPWLCSMKYPDDKFYEFSDGKTPEECYFRVLYRLTHKKRD